MSAARPPEGARAAVTMAAAWASAVQRGLERLDAQLLLAHLLGLPAARARAWLLAHDTDPLAPAVASRYAELVERRLDGVPLAYLVGEKEFYGLRLAVSPEVLVPRPDTETLVAWAVELAQPLPAPRLADLGTGSGAIALALKHLLPHAEVTATDLSPAALAVARGNGERLGLPVRWRQGCWWEALAGEADEQHYDVVASNPPYIAERDPHLAALRHEPLQALASGPLGLDALRQIVAGAPDHLTDGGWLLFEHGHEQADDVQALLRKAGFVDVSTRVDLAGRPRCTGGRWQVSR
ncbi:peptide chain release factor N(5)-glutamine methyltransferase [Caldimonas brevitalea]|uniref:Release factor glutamine methyltransferase n=1 Tax=Caldimonas brevitalea TaxID=413882 RepID=A0A0G3BTH6_9BURK|nr:peptide chain release factor N(5)-glutamine methyltransferase [Caldimonas brevitalea]AKJ31288.1 SAM-dependent methyltransferase [Caldimonas brevitalea]